MSTAPPRQIPLPLDGASEGARLREAGIAQAEAGAPAVAMADALEAVEYVAGRRPRFTTDHVWARLLEMGAVSFPEPRAMGAVMRQAEQQGWAAQTRPQQYVQSRRRACHRRPLLIWVSRLCPPGARSEEGVP